jgi:hypothetical protein
MRRFVLALLVAAGLALVLLPAARTPVLSARPSGGPGFLVHKSCPSDAFNPGDVVRCSYTITNSDTTSGIYIDNVRNTFAGTVTDNLICTEVFLTARGSSGSSCSGTIDETMPSCGLSNTSEQDTVEVFGSDAPGGLWIGRAFVNLSACTPTPSNTPTITPTATPTPTATLTNTPTFTPTPNTNIRLHVTKSCPGGPLPPGSAQTCSFSVQNMDPASGVTGLAVTDQYTVPGGPTVAVDCKQSGSPVTALGAYGAGGGLDTCTGTVVITLVACDPILDTDFADKITASGTDTGCACSTTGSSLATTEVDRCTPIATSTPTNTPTRTPTPTPTRTPTNFPGQYLVVGGSCTPTTISAGTGSSSCTWTVQNGDFSVGVTGLAVTEDSSPVSCRISGSPVTALAVRGTAGLDTCTVSQTVTYYVSCTSNNINVSTTIRATANDVHCSPAGCSSGTITTSLTVLACTPTPSATATITPTGATPTPSNTPTITQTPTITPTNAPTVTGTPPTSTPTITGSRTATPTPMRTPTSTPTNTPTPRPIICGGAIDVSVTRLGSGPMITGLDIPCLWCPIPLHGISPPIVGGPPATDVRGVGQTYAATASGGTPPYIYFWSCDFNIQDPVFVPGVDTTLCRFPAVRSYSVEALVYDSTNARGYCGVNVSVVP